MGVTWSFLLWGSTKEQEGKVAEFYGEILCIN